MQIFSKLHISIHNPKIEKSTSRKYNKKKDKIKLELQSVIKKVTSSKELKL